MGIAIYRTAIAPDWIDYNGHLRDAYYGLIVSLACDALMDRIGMDAGYRERTHNTLYTLEMHQHFLREVHRDDTVEVRLRILGIDRKRLHVAFDLACAGRAGWAATAEVMLIHVHQGATNATAPFDEPVRAALEALADAAARLPADTPGAEATPPGSRQMLLKPRPA